MLRRFVTAVSFALSPFAFTSPAAGQPEHAGEVADAVETLASAFESTHECRLTIDRNPRLDDFTGQWSLSFSASGAECDSLLPGFREQASALDVQLFRRPNGAQLRGLLADMTRSVGSMFPCRMTFFREPRFDEAASQWFVSYLLAGADCEAAGHELRRQGDQYRIVFLLRIELGLINEVR